MSKKEIVQVSPIGLRPEEDFVDLRELQSNFGYILGIQLVQERKQSRINFEKLKYVLHLIAQLVLFTFCYFLMSRMIQAHKQSQSVLSLDVYSLCGSIMFLIMSFEACTIFYYQPLLCKLLNQCEQMYRLEGSAGWMSATYKQCSGSIHQKIRIMHLMSMGDPIFLKTAAIIMCLVTKKVHLALPVYTLAGWMEELKWAVFFNIIVVVLSFYFNRVLFYFFSLFTILVHHVAGEYKYLSLAVREIQVIKHNEISSEKMEVTGQLKIINKRHSNVIDMINNLDTIFGLPFLASEIFCIVGIPLVSYGLLIDQSVLNASIGSLFVLLFSMFYSFLGQYIITSAEEFETAVNECEWLDFKPSERKFLAYIMQMAQKQLGIRSAGFHLVDHKQLMQVNAVFFRNTEIFEVI